MPEQFLGKPSGRAERDQEEGLFRFESDEGTGAIDTLFKRID